MRHNDDNDDEGDDAMLMIDVDVDTAAAARFRRFRYTPAYTVQIDEWAFEGGFGVSPPANSENDQQDVETT